MATKKRKLSKRKRLSHHRHSGRLLPHHHTSYFGLSLLLAFIGTLLAFFSYNRVAALTLNQSGSINIAGIVYGVPPSTPAVITNPSDGATLNTAVIAVSGTCGAGLVVKVSRNGVLAGSTICAVDGTFSLQISLVEGENILQARNYDFQNQAGPDSPDVRVVYQVPATITPAQPGSAAKAAATRDPLVVTTNQAYKTVKPNESVNWAFDISGGQVPYAALVDWGDGATALISVEKAGLLAVNHAYTRAGNYKIIVRVTDAAGAQATIEVVAVVVSSQVIPSITQEPRFYDQVLPLLLAWPLYLFLALLVISFWLGQKYELHLLKKWGLK